MSRRNVDNSGPRNLDNSGLFTIEGTNGVMSSSAGARMERIASDGATVVCFPLSRRIGLVRSAAAELATRDYQAGRRYWAMHTQQLRIELRNTGATPSQVRFEMARYADAVGEALLLHEQV